MNDYFHVEFTDKEIQGISNLGLAHLGDGVFELLVRVWLCKHGRATAAGLHHEAVAHVNAAAQAEAAEKLKEAGYPYNIIKTVKNGCITV